MPNVQNKRLWSDALDRWVPFKVTTAAIKAVDYYGGVDNYLLALDDRLVDPSNYITKVRREISTALFLKGELPEKMVKHLGYDKNPPVAPTADVVQDSV
jgi:ribosomal protein L28